MVSPTKCSTPSTNTTRSRGAPLSALFTSRNEIGSGHTDRTGIVRYLSTREPGHALSTRSFAEVLLAGLAEDGGLYVPDRMPGLAADSPGVAGLPYAEIAARIVALFAGGAFPPGEIQRLAATAYSQFRHAAVAPLVQLDESLWLLELFHGPTLA